jgi:nicotinamide-nucleotide amidase
MADTVLLSLAQELGTALKTRGWMLALAESCTGGLTSGVITEIAGSSAWFDCSFVTYSNAAKMDMLGVSANTLNTHGAVSIETAQEMALGALKHSHAQITAAITGIAGPDGGNVDKPVGTVCFAWTGINLPLITCTKHFAGSRQEIREQAVKTAIEGLINIQQTG